MPQQVDFDRDNGNYGPTIITESGVPELEHSELRKIASDALNAAKYTFVSVAANPDQAVQAESLAQVFKESLDRLDAPKRERFQRQAGYLAEASPEVREMVFGRYGQLASGELLEVGLEQVGDQVAPLPIDAKLLGVKRPEITVPLAALEQTPQGLLIPAVELPADFATMAQQAADSQVYNLERLEEIWGPLPTAVETTQTELNALAGASAMAQAVTDMLEFYISRIKCVDETNPEWPGHDEIKLGGISIDETGDTKKIPVKFIGGGFDDGDQKWYSPPWRYHVFSLREGKYWPKAYVVNLVLAEEDDEGISKFLDEAWKLTRDHVKREIEKAVTGTLSQYLGPAIAAAIGKAAAWVVNKLAEWLIDFFKDDLFPVHTARVTVPSFNARWNYPDGRWGSSVSPLQRAHFYGHNGHYYIDYYWKLV